MPKFEIIEVKHEAPLHDETVGNKFKFWFRRNDKEWLFKQGRPRTGENWAEKIAAELAERLGLPHAQYELATWNNKPGVVSPSFLPLHGDFTHGNELLQKAVEDYPDASGSSRHPYRVPQHTLDVVLELVGMDEIELPLKWIPPVGVTTAAETFVGYLLLDAWVGNTDRHDRNWGFVWNTVCETVLTTTLHLAPTYDHASCLGRQELDENRQARLTTTDAEFSVQAYARKARSAFYETAQCAKPMTTFDTFRLAAQRYPKAANVWLDRLATISHNDVAGLFGRIPSPRISQPAIDFALAMLDTNSTRLLELKEYLR